MYSGISTQNGGKVSLDDIDAIERNTEPQYASTADNATLMVDLLWSGVLSSKV